MLMKYFPNCRSVFTCHYLATSESSNCRGRQGAQKESHFIEVFYRGKIIDSTAFGTYFDSKEPQTMLL